MNSTSKSIRPIILMVVVMVVLSVLFVGIVSAKSSTIENNNIAVAQDVSQKPTGLQLEKVDGGDVVDLNEIGTYIVQLQDPPLALYAGGIEGLAPTHAGSLGEGKLDANSLASQAYMDYLLVQQDKTIKAMNAELGRNVNILYQYKASLNGYAAELSGAEALTVAAMPDVRHIEPEGEYELHTDAGPAWMGAPGVWDGSTTGVPGTMGEGIIVGVIDTGIDPWNPSFLDVGSDGYNHDNPWGSSVYVGVCDPLDPSYDATFPCNDKLIGAWGYASLPGGPRDSNGHGSHTASTAAGNFVDDAVINAPTDVYTANISGVAPHANIVMYAACCTGAALTAAKDQIVLDGVDVVNYSIGSTSPTGDPWNSADATQWRAAREAGIYVATSAGNAGPGDETVGSPGDIPWITTVGASSHNRVFLTTLVMTNSNPLSPTVVIEGQAMTAGLPTPTDIVFAVDYGDNLCGPGSFAPATFTGQIVVCERGTWGRVEKGQSVADGGAGGYILAQPAEFGGGPGSASTDPHVIPASHIDYYQYQALLAAYADGYTMGTITGAVMDTSLSNGDIMASFSSRGANRALPDLIVPSITAPGRAIWAAYHQGASDGEYTFNVIQGTSMSSPHVAGAYALLKALHPDWTAAEAQSAFMTTARNTVLNDDGVNVATPFAQGSGHVNVSAAANAGFVLDITEAEYIAADPSTGGDVKELNTASLGNANCVGACSWTRTVRSVLPIAATYTATATAPAGVVVTVSPPTFTLAAGASQELTIDANVSGATLDNWAFATVSFETDAVLPVSTVALNEGFEGAFPPVGWTVITDTNAGWNTNVFWGRANITPGANGQAAGADSDAFGDGLDTTLYSSVFDLSGATAANVTFDSNFQDFAGNGDAWMDISTDGGTIWTNIHYLSTDEPAAGMSYNYDLTAYVGSTAQLRFRFMTPAWDWYWYIDDVVVNSFGVDTNEVPDMHMPIAVIPAAGNIPSLLNEETRRDMGSQTYDELQAIEITDSQVTMYGPTEATLDEIMLAQDPSNGDPYNNLDDVFYTTFTVPANAKRMVAEITASEAPDADLFWGSGLTPSAGTQLGASTTGSWDEYLSAADPAAGDYWVLVQNWGSSGAGAVDAIVLATAVVPDSASGLATFEMPTAVPGGDLFSAKLVWNLPGSMAGDHFYGAMDLGTDAGNPDNLGRTDIDIARLEDDVMKSANTATALPGDVVTYTITIAANDGDTPLAYSITDTIPAGLTYVPGSATGGATVTGNVLTWSGVQNPLGRNYVVSNSLSDPSCTMPLANSGSYVNLEAFGFLANAGITANGTWQDTGYGGGPYAFYGDNSGTNTGTNLYFNGDGFVTLDAASVLGGPYAQNSNLPDAALPNALLSMIWNPDIQIVYEAGTGSTNRGVTTGIQLSTGGVPSAKLLEFDDVELLGDSSSRADFEMMIREAIDDAAGTYEIVFAYDNLTGDFASGLLTGTIGVENYDGNRASVYAFDDANLATLENGMAICFDWIVDTSAGAHEITYQATVDGGVSPGTELTNVVEHINNAPDTSMETAEAMVTVIAPVYGVELSGDEAISGAPEEVVTYTLTVTNTGDVMDTFTIAISDTWGAAAPASVMVNAGESTTFDVEVTIPASANDADSDVATVSVTSDNDAGATDSADLTTTAVIVPVYGVELSGDAALSGAPEEVVTYTVTVTNTGNMADDFTIDVSDVWGATAPVSVTLGAGASSTFDVEVTVLATAGDGDSDVAMVTVTSDSDAAATASVDLTTTAVITEYLIFLPVVMKP